MNQSGKESPGTKGCLAKGVDVLLGDKGKGRPPRKVPTFRVQWEQINHSGEVLGLPLASDCFEVS